MIEEMKKGKKEQAKTYAEGLLIKKTFKIHITRRQNELNRLIDPFIEELENGKKHLRSESGVEKIDRIIKKLKKVMKRIDRFNREIDFIPPMYFKI